MSKSNIEFDESIQSMERDRKEQPKKGRETERQREEKPMIGKERDTQRERMREREIVREKQLEGAPGGR